MVQWFNGTGINRYRKLQGLASSLWREYGAGFNLAAVTIVGKNLKIRD